jgi:hypothetical protein
MLGIYRINDVRRLNVLFVISYTPFCVVRRVVEILEVQSNIAVGYFRGRISANILEGVNGTLPQR